MRKIALLLMLSPLMAFAQSSIDETIKLNQVGMYPEQEKVAVIENGAHPTIPMSLISTAIRRMLPTR